MFHKSSKRGGRGRGGSFGGNDQSRRDKKGYLSEEMMSHYRRVSDSLNQLQEEGEEQNTDFVNNIFSSLAEEVVQVSQNQTVSSIIESLIAIGSPSNLRTLYVAAAADLSVAFLDRFASHVFENLVQRLAQFYHPPVHSSTDDEEDDVSQDKFVESFEAMCEFVESNFETLVTHMYGSHVLRGLLEALSGVPVANELKKSQKSGHGRFSKSNEEPLPVQDTKPPEQFKELFDRYATKVFRICDYEVHLKDPYFSLMLQAVLMIWHKADTDLCQRHCQTITQRVTESCAQSDDPTQCLPDMAQDPAGSRLLEVMFRLSSPELLQRVFDGLLGGRMLYYAIHPVANYVLQRFISSVKDTGLLEKVFEELSKHLEDVFAVGYFGLVISLAEACKRLRVKQDEFVMSLMDTFHCKEPVERQKSVVKLIVSLTTYEVFFSLEEGKEEPAEGTEARSVTAPVNIHGSLLLQELLQFQKPKHAALGVLDLKQEELQVLCCDPSGSHAVDVFFSSPSILPKNRDIFLRKLKPVLVEVACTKNGSRCLESMWRNFNVDQRTLVAKELAENDRLRSDRFGHFLFRNFGLALFLSKRKGWLEQQSSQARRKRVIKELLHGPEAPTKKKKKESQQELSAQNEENQEDPVTAMFLKLKKENDRQHTSSPQPQDKHHSESGNEASPSLPSMGEEQDKKKAKKKKKKDKLKGKGSSSAKSSEVSSTGVESGDDADVNSKDHLSSCGEEPESPVKDRVKKKKGGKSKSKNKT